METFSALLAICAGNSPVPGEYPAQRPVTRSFDVFFDLRLNIDWVNNREAGDLRCYRAHYDVIVMRGHMLLSQTALVCPWGKRNSTKILKPWFPSVLQIQLHLRLTWWQKGPGPRFNIKMSSYQYRKSHCGDKTVVTSSYLHNSISYTGKTASLYWFSPQGISRNDTDIMFNALRLNDTYMCQQTNHHCRLAGTKPLSEPILEYC